MAECLLPGVAPVAPEALAGWARPELSRSARHHVLFRGLLLMPEDEVLLCLFAGAAAEVRRVSEWVGVARRADCRLCGAGRAVGAGGVADERASAGGPPGIRAGRRASRNARPERHARPWKREE